MADQENRFFTKEEYETEIALNVNADVLKRIYADDVKPSDKLKVEFVFVTDSKEKAEELASQIVLEYPNYSDIKIKWLDGYWDICGTTDKIKMSLNEINYWNQALWDLGYTVDCKLDGWQVEI